MTYLAGRGNKNGRAGVERLLKHDRLYYLSLQSIMGLYRTILRGIIPQKLQSYRPHDFNLAQSGSSSSNQVTMRFFSVHLSPFNLWYCFFHAFDGLLQIQSSLEKAQMPDMPLLLQIFGLFARHPYVSVSVSFGFSWLLKGTLTIIILPTLVSYITA